MTDGSYRILTSHSTATIYIKLNYANSFPFEIMVNDRNWCSEMLPGIKCKKCRRSGSECMLTHKCECALHYIAYYLCRQDTITCQFPFAEVFTQIHCRFHRLLKAVSLTLDTMTCFGSITNYTYLGRPGVPACASISDEGNIQAIHILQQKMETMNYLRAHSFCTYSIVNFDAFLHCGTRIEYR